MVQVLYLTQLGMNVVRVMKGVGGVCAKCACVWLGAV